MFSTGGLQKAQTRAQGYNGFHVLEQCPIMAPLLLSKSGALSGMYRAACLKKADFSLTV